MKWMKMCAALAAGAMLACAVHVSAKSIEEIHGATVYAGDGSLSEAPENFVQVDGGSGSSTYADVSSAYVVVEDEDLIVVEALVWGFVHKSGNFYPYNRCSQFALYKPTGRVYHFRDGSPYHCPGDFILTDNTARLFAEAIRRREEMEAEAGSAGATVETVRRETGGTFSYPVIRLEDKEIEATINEAIEAEVREFYERGQYFRRYRHRNDRISLDYTIGLNDGERLSLVLHQRFHYAGAPLEHMEPIGMTFDLATGQRLDLEDYDEIAEDAGCPEAYLPDAINLRARQAKGLLGDHVFARDNNRFFISEDGHVTYLFERVGRVRAYQTEQGAWDEETTEAAKTFFIDLDAPMEMAQ